MLRNTNSASRLNLILGDSAGGTFRFTFGRSENLLIDPDVLSCGPTPPRGDLDAWRALRLKYWMDLVPRMFENYETWPDDVLHNVPRLSDADRITIWAAITGDASNMRTTEAELTPLGLDILEGRASNFPANPIEEWAAGVQLSSSRGPLWFRDGDRLIAPVSGAESAS